MPALNEALLLIPALTLFMLNSVVSTNTAASVLPFSAIPKEDLFNSLRACWWCFDFSCLLNISCSYFLDLVVAHGDFRLNSVDVVRLNRGGEDE